MVITDAELLEQIERFLARSGMSQTRFGVETMKDGALVEQLRAGRSLTLRNAERVMRFMAAYKSPTPKAAA
ncbi:hypothetical protein GG804_25175 [Sphingomonas histidinilytica]|uniref:hypothetical protein n=1 Tax=Rhizorhabdus histidinilytica TaxID=439228 RepID=UPI001AD9F081|nr:hypothetical protein [Rhizorhabdus histidinilytica]MBO9380065.1 hypothetical protein [Rhizorhabdus histidinilytica]